jgi:hypothetical protein
MENLSPANHLPADGDLVRKKTDEEEDTYEHQISDSVYHGVTYIWFCTGSIYFSCHDHKRYRMTFYFVPKKDMLI